jgi:hypothetical protein
VQEFTVGASTAALGDVGCDRDRRSTQLRRESESFGYRKVLGMTIGCDRKPMRVLGDHEVVRVLHAGIVATVAAPAGTIPPQ